jgi:hypothetical protein
MSLFGNLYSCLFLLAQSNNILEPCCIVLGIVLVEQRETLPQMDLSGSKIHLVGKYQYYKEPSKKTLNATLA